MKTEEKSSTTTFWKGNVDGSLSYRIQPMGHTLYVSYMTDNLGSFMVFRSLPHALNFYRDLGDALNHLQPGLTLPLPGGDPNEVDAMRVVYEADQLQRGIV